MTGVRIGLNAPFGDFDPLTFPGGWRLEAGPRIIPCCFAAASDLVPAMGNGVTCWFIIMGIDVVFFVDADIGERLMNVGAVSGRYT